MAGSRQGVPDLRIGVPTLEPDPAFIAQLSALAAAAAVPVGVRPPHHLKVALAAASVAAIATGGAWASGALAGNDSPTPPTGPVDHPTAPILTPSGTTHEPSPADTAAPEGSGSGTGTRPAGPGEQSDGSAGDDAPEESPGPAGAPLPTEDESGDESGGQPEPDDDDEDDSSGSDTDADADNQAPGGDVDDLDDDDDSAGDDGSERPDPSDADD